MTNDDDASRLIRLAITRDAESPLEVADRLGDERAYGLMSAAIAVAASRRFPEGTKLSEVRDYADEMRGRFPNAVEILNPAVVESVIRAALGEDDQLDGLTTRDVAPLLFVLTYAMATESPMGEEETDAFVLETLMLAESG